MKRKPGILLVVIFLAVLRISGLHAEGGWVPLAEDGLHDQTAPATDLLQEPQEALSALLPGKAGNKVDWVASLRMGYIDPRTNIYPETKVEVLDLDIVFSETSNLPMVVFPHKAHTEWLDCSNCHEKLFKSEAGVNQFGMLDILMGESCGQCHGAVAFPLTECQRCHSLSRN